MFSNIFKKAALFGASTVASVAVTGTMMASSAQAATMTYRSEFSVTSNSLNNADLITGHFDFSKTEENNGEFSYKVTSFNANVLNERITLSDMRANQNPFLAINQTFVPRKYQTILPSVLAGESPNYTGDGDFGEGNLSYTFGFDLGNPNFQPDDFDFAFSSEDLDNVATLASNVITSVDPSFTQFYVPFALRQGGQINITTKAVPEPATIFALGAVGVGLTATRRKRASKKIKQKTAA
ncbi:PEP-CTERM putative exosortase interaction domain-containing protein [Rivularia sp. PCC 7116]|uniref:PEP-CTERM sorting domain-containing protein n=1 Tax=Rivularia sp. PCC 7116 TaxID=373994 RepID=UPI00029F3BFA|nr:PEP-CTERM sorting domain-containing protein [Rivularia sp. PCC 7116]AFY55990.1 PEP-CTERM putative exosortase interaction domain-containing protein [Rivularia sp. PCC 7116]